MLNTFYGFSTIIALFFILLPEAALCETITASSTPWSGYWWPLNQGGLVTGDDYRGHPAPLEKYDLLAKGLYPGTLSTWYTNNFYDPQTPPWYGHCDSWSKASILENYPILPSSEDNIIFRVGDKKGLLTLAHRIDLLERAAGTANNFHLWLLTYLKDQSVPFFADLDPSEEKWYYPIFQYTLKSIKSGSKESVTATIFYAEDSVPPDYLGTKINERNYTYDLQLDAGGNIVGGAWTGGSLIDHPEILFFPITQQTDAPLDYHKVRKIAENKDDLLEHGDATVPIGPGTYNLVLLDPDNYAIASQAGEAFNLTIEKKEGSTHSLETILQNGDGSWVVPGTLASDNVPLTRKISNSDIAPYIFHVFQEDYSDPNIYSVVLDQQKNFMQQIPFLPKNGMWTGFALTNDSDEPIDNVMLTSHDDKGIPLHTLVGPLTLAAGEKRLFLADSLPFRLHEYIKTKGLTLLADKEVQFVSLIGSGNLLASQVQKNASGSHLIIPETVEFLANGRNMAGSIRNETLDTQQITIRSYKSDGSLVGEISKTLAGHELLPIISGQAPFANLPDKGWIDVSSQNGREVSGFINLTSRESLDALFGLIVENGSQYIPHVPPPLSWLSTVTLINASSEENILKLHAVLARTDTSDDIVVTLAPHEKRVVSVGEEFGRLEGDPLYHSIVEISGGHDFVGYYTYKKQSGGDIVSYPLLNSSHFKEKLTMPHNPEIDFWWTGIVLCNPLAIAQTILVDAYDTSGKLMAGATRELNLPPGGYEAFSVAALFPTAVREISFVVCRTATGQGAIGGFYLYGNHYNSSLSGAIM